MLRVLIVACLATGLVCGTAGATDDAVWTGRLEVATRARVYRANATVPGPVRVQGARLTFDAATFDVAGGTFALRARDGDAAVLVGAIVGDSGRTRDLELDAASAEWLREHLHGISDWDPTVADFGSHGRLRMSRSGRRMQTTLVVDDIVGNVETNPLSNFDYVGRIRLRMRARR